MDLTLAPLHGFTDAAFRKVYFNHFSGFNTVVAPFISLTHGNRITELKVRDLHEGMQASVDLIPQILGNDPHDFILLCKYLSEEMGFREVNWNLGCPTKSIVNKQRGSGILPYPDRIREILEQIIPNISLGLSVKMRLGLNTAGEFPPVIEVLNAFPLESITIHPRVGIQQYEGRVMLDELEEFLPLIRHRIIYNGDVHSFQDYEMIRKRFPFLDSIMLGRGIFYNPFLPEMIQTGNPNLPAEAKRRFREFYHELEATTRNGRHYWMSKLKEYWKYFSRFLELGDRELQELMRCKGEEEWQNLVFNVFNLHKSSREK